MEATEDITYTKLFRHVKNIVDSLSKEEELAFAEEDYQVNVRLFNKLIPWIMNALERKADGRLRSISIYSRNGIKDILKRIMQGINHSVENHDNEG